MFLNKLGIFKIKVVNLQSKQKQKRMKYITKQETVEAIKELFDYENNKESNNVIVVENKEEDRTTFMVNKQYLERFEVIDKLQSFFADKVIDDGQCRVDNITFVFTSFFIENRSV